MIYELNITGDPYRFTGRANYSAGDANETVIVRASSEQHAREVAAASASEEGAAAWMDPTTTVKLIDPDGEPCKIGVW